MTPLDAPLPPSFADTPIFRTRILIDGVIQAEDWTTLNNAAEISARHVAIAEQAHREGKLYVVEMYDPDTDRYTRFGTDPAGMAENPRVVTDFERQVIEPSLDRIDRTGGL